MDVYERAIEWIQEAARYIENRRYNENIEAYRIALDEINQFMRNYTENLSETQSHLIQQQRWFRCANLEEYVSNAPKRKKNKEVQHACQQCGHEMIKNGETYKCSNCSLVTMGFERLNPSSSNSKTHYERGIDELPEWLDCIAGKASLSQAVEEKYDLIEKQIIALLVSKIPNPKLQSMSYKGQCQACRIIVSKRKINIRDYISDKDVRRIFRSLGLAQHYKYCNTALFRAVEFEPSPEFAGSDLELISSAYSHVLRKFDEARKSGEMKNNRYAPCVIKCIIATFRLASKYKEFVDVIPQKNNKTEEALFNRIVDSLQDFSKQ